MLISPATVFGPSLSEDPQHGQSLLLKVRQHLVVEYVGCRDRRLSGLPLGKRSVGVSIDKGLLVEAADAFESAYVESILRP